MENNKTNTLKGFMSFLLWMLIFGFIVRMFETVLLTHYHQDFGRQLTSCLLGFGADVLFFAKASIILFPVYLIIRHFSEKAAKWTFRIIGTLMLLISNAMVMYFVAAYIPLGKVFFDYSVSELVYIAKTTEPFVWWGYVGLLLIPFAFLLLSSKEFRYRKAVLIAWLAICLISLFVWKVPEKLYSSKEQKNTIENKQKYFIESLFSKEDSFVQFNMNDFEESKARIEDFQSLFPDVEFIDERYPFCHVDKSPEVLSGFFNLKQGEKPNLVFILTEGLSREFSGYNSKLPSATPFLDSLADKSLTWINCMSSSQRTIGILPTLFGSLPFGKRGFMQSSNTPRFHSLIKTLKHNGYNPSFFYGGWLCFDEMCYFLNDNEIDNYLLDYHEYPDSMLTSWGLYDEYVFSESLKKINFEDAAPRLDIYLTLTTHDPFDYPDKETYTKKYKDILKASGKENLIPEFQHEQYASYLYYDDCLRNFFKTYSSKPGFENTIFIITGDHCFNAQSEELDKYHVPFVVWSPMLKEAHRFPAMVTHRDVTPSLLAMMKNAYGMDTPDIVAWLNTGLDTVSFFRSKTFTPQLKESRIMGNFVYQDNFYDDGNAYKFDYKDGKLLLNPSDAEFMKKLVSEYKALDDYVMNNDALIKNENQQKLLLSIDSLTNIEYCQTKTWKFPIDTLGKTQVFHLNTKYPFDFVKQNVDNDMESVTIRIDFDLYIPKTNEAEKIYLVFSDENPVGGSEIIKTYVVNYDWFENYGKWYRFTTTQHFSRSTINWSNDSELKCYINNPSCKDFYISDFSVKVVGDY